jgi:hypothetical protein
MNEIDRAMKETRPSKFVELDYREDDGLEVALVWNRSTKDLSVAVFDRARCRFFVVAVRENQRALDVFHHPLAYYDAS